MSKPYIYRDYVPPYYDCRQDDPDSVRLSFDIPFEVRERIRHHAPFRGFWKYACGQFVQSIDQALQSAPELSDLTYADRQHVTFEVVRQITTQKVDLATIIHNVLLSNRPTIPNVPSNSDSNTNV